MAKLNQIRENAAGIDVGSEKIFVAMPDASVHNFRTFTSDFELCIKLLQQYNITTVAMESTGVYGIVLHEMLQKACIEVYLVNPSHVKHVPGRKTDVQDCQWLQQLHSYGLLKNSFIPPAQIKELRNYVRIRENYIKESSTCVLRMQKALTLMNVRLHQVINQIHGASGMRIIKAILSGERDSEKLLQMCDVRIIKKKKEDVILSLKGNYSKEYLFSLKQALECYEFYQNKIKDCDQLIEESLVMMGAGTKMPDKITKAKPIRHHKPNIQDYHRKILAVMNGRDITSLPGITDYNLMQIIAEIGTELSPWPTEKHFTSWLGLSPGKHTSGKLIKKPKIKSMPRAGLIFREAAQSLLGSKHIALGHFGRRLRAKKGSYVAIKATARKLAELYYRACTKGLEYVEQGIKAYQERLDKIEMMSLIKKAKRLNLTICAPS